MRWIEEAVIASAFLAFGAVVVVKFSQYSTVTATTPSSSSSSSSSSKKIVRGQLPKGYRGTSSGTVTEESSADRRRHPSVPPNRDRYAPTKVPSNVDVIVVGSGIGGLSCAAYLSRVGLRVLVIEQHYIAGGCTHSFDEEGFEFETGIHYIGNIEKRMPLLNLITAEPIQWAKMGREDPKNWIYDEFWLGNEHYSFRSGLEQFRADLKQAFPADAAAVDAYIALVQSTANKDLFFKVKIVRPTWLRDLLVWLCCGSFLRVVGETTYDVLRKLTSNEKLISVLCAQWGDCGRPPKHMSWFMHASVANHYFEGGYYPVGGTSVIANRIIPVIEASGGRVLVAKKVQRILLEGGGSSGQRKVARGVVLDDGAELRARLCVVSNVGLVNTYSRLLSPEQVRPFPYHKFMDKVGVSKSQVFVFVGLQGSTEELGLRSCNTWIWPSQDYDQCEVAFDADPLHAPVPMFVACGSAKDPDWKNRHGTDKSTALIIAFISMEQFRAWEHQPYGDRGEEYNSIKEQLKARMIEEGLLRVYPKCRGRIAFTSVGTPCSVQHFLGYKDGEVYGLNIVPARFQHNITPDTPVSGLYLTGQDVTTVGFTGALVAGLLTASSILGYGTVRDILTKRNLVSDLEYLDEVEARQKKNIKISSSNSKQL